MFSCFDRDSLSEDQDEDTGRITQAEQTESSMVYLLILFGVSVTKRPFGKPSDSRFHDFTSSKDGNNGGDDDTLGEI